MDWGETTAHAFRFPRFVTEKKKKADRMDQEKTAMLNGGTAPETNSNRRKKKARRERERESKRARYKGMNNRVVKYNSLANK